MTKRRKKPYDPASAAKAALERQQNAEMISTLQRQPDTALNICDKTGKLMGAKRRDCLSSLITDEQDRQSVDWLEVLIRTASGENTQERRPDFIPSSIEGAPGQNITQAQIDASRIVAAVEALLPPTTFALLTRLLAPDAALESQWRGVVQSVTGEPNPAAQGALVRSSAAALTWARGRVEKKHR